MNMKIKKSKKVTAPAMGVKGKAVIGKKGLPKMCKGGMVKKGGKK